MFKPMLANDADLSKLKYPLFAQQKTDGVRGLNRDYKLVGRSLKPPKNKFTVNRWSHSQFNGFDGELFSGYEPTIQNLCRITSSEVGTVEGMPITSWMVFDLLDDNTIDKPYEYRFKELEYRINELKIKQPELEKILMVPKNVICTNLDEFLHWEEQWLNDGYEGVIIRKIDGLYKNGRSTVKEGGLLRVKRFIEEEALVIAIKEAEENLNELQTNELGNSFRSSHQENKIGNGMVGSLICKLIKDVIEPQTKKVLFEKNQIITISPGCLTHEQRRTFFLQQDLIVGKLIKFKSFPKGVKDKPRFPTFDSIVNQEDR